MSKENSREKTKLSLNRRKFMTYSGGVIVAGAASTLPAPAVHAAKTVKIGFVSPQTGPLAPFGEADQFVLAEARAALKGGIKIGGKTYPVEIISRDSQSNPNRAAEVTAQLILKDNVNIMIGSSSGEPVNPVCGHL